MLDLFGGLDDPRTLDPALASDTQSQFFVRQLCRRPGAAGRRYAGRARLAAALPEVSEDGLVYTFTLRSGVTWPDGTALVAGDVAYSLERATDPALAAPQAADTLPAALYLAGIVGVAEKLAGQVPTLDGVQTPDPQTVVITLVEPQSFFLHKLTVGPAAVVDRRNLLAGGSSWWRSPQATGPFRVREWRPAR